MRIMQEMEWGEKRTAAFNVTPNYEEKMKRKKINDSSHKPLLYNATVIVHFTFSLSPDYDNDYSNRWGQNTTSQSPQKEEMAL